MADVEKKMLFVVSANVVDFNKKIGDAEKAFTRSMGNIQNELKKVSLAGIGMAAAITAPMVLAFKDSAQWAEDITNLSAKLGMNIETTQRWKAVMDQTGQTGDDMITIIKKMSDNIVAASEGNQAAIDMFRKLGISWKDLMGLPIDQQFGAILDALAKMPEGVDKIALSTDLLGKGGQKILPALGENWRKLFGEISVVSDGTIEKLAASQKAMEKLDLAWKTMVANMVGIAFAEDATRGIDELTKKLNELSDWATKNPETVRAITGIALAVAALAAVIGTLAGIAWAIIQISGAVGILKVAFAALPILLGGGWSGAIAVSLGVIGGALKSVGIAVAAAFGGTVLVTIGAFVLAIGGVAFFVYALVTEWDRLGQLIGIVGDIIRNNLNIAINQARLAFMQARDGIINAWNTVVDFFKGVVEGVKNAFVTVGDWLAQPFKDAWVQIQQICSDIQNAWNNLFSGQPTASTGRQVAAGVSSGGTSPVSNAAKAAPVISAPSSDIENQRAWWRANYGTEPSFALGGIAMKPMRAIVGDNGPEAIMPLNRLAEIIPREGITVNVSMPIGTYVGDDMSKRALVRDLSRYFSEELRRLVTPQTQTSFYSPGGHL